MLRRIGGINCVAHRAICYASMIAGKALQKLYYASILIRKGGLGLILHHLWSQTYGKTTYIWVAKDLSSADSGVLPSMRYYLQPASPDTLKRVLHSLNGEKGPSVYELLRRRSFYEHGFKTCYIAVSDSGELLHMSWLLSARHNDLIRAHYPLRIGELKQGEVLLENCFTFPRYRGKGVMTSVTLDLAKVARSQGFDRMIAYVDRENRTSLRAFYRAGFHPFAEVQEVRLFFTIRGRKEVSRQRR